MQVAGICTERGQVAALMSHRRMSRAVIAVGMKQNPSCALLLVLPGGTRSVLSDQGPPCRLDRLASPSTGRGPFR